MSGLEELRTRVEAAEARFGLIHEQNRKYSDRLVEVVTAMERAQAGQNQEIAALNAEIGRYENENETLRGMLMSLLAAIEGGSSLNIHDAMRDMDRRIAAMVGEGAGAPAPAETDATPAEADATPAEVEAGPAAVEPQPDVSPAKVAVPDDRSISDVAANALKVLEAELAAAGMDDGAEAVAAHEIEGDEVEAMDAVAEAEDVAEVEVAVADEADAADAADETPVADDDIAALLAGGADEEIAADDAEVATEMSDGDADVADSVAEAFEAPQTEGADLVTDETPVAEAEAPSETVAVADEPAAETAADEEALADAMSELSAEDIDSLFDDKAA